jgi:hypothetical protein
MSKDPYHMYPFHLVEIEADYRRQSCLDACAAHRLARETGLHRRGPLHEAVCKALCGLGHLLVTAGRRLEHLGAPSSA